MLDVLYEDNHLLVVNKPAGIATMGAESGPTLHSLAANYIRVKYNKPGKAFVGIVSRLDRVTSGVIVLARTSKAASRLTPQFSPNGKVRAQKVYLAIVDGIVEADAGCFVDSLWKDDKAMRMRVAKQDRDDTKLAELSYTVVNRNDEETLVAVRLKSGRKHQIRCQFAHRNHCVLGDRKYGSNRSFPERSSRQRSPSPANPKGKSHVKPDRIALHSLYLAVTHPTTQERLEFVAPPRPEWLGKSFATAFTALDWKTFAESLGIETEST